MKSRQAWLGLAWAALLLFALRHDLAVLAQSLGANSLQAGDLNAAARSFRLAATLGGAQAAPAYDLGVAFYRRGDFASAQERFTAALATAGPTLAGAAHYNLGNCLFRQAEAAGGPETVDRLLRAAAAQYTLALAANPGAADASANLGLVGRRLAGLAVRGKKRGQDGQATDTALGQTPPGRTAMEGGKGQTGDTRDADGAAARRARADSVPDNAGIRWQHLSGAEAERLLSEARGREHPVGSLAAIDRPAKAAAPERDW